MDQEVLLQVMKARLDSGRSLAIQAWMWMMAVGAAFFLSGFAAYFGWDDLGAAVNVVIGLVLVLLGGYLFHKTPAMTASEIEELKKRIKVLEDAERE